MAGVAQPHIYRHFTWQAWHHLTSTVVLRGRRGTYGTGWRAWTWLGARDAAALCVAGVAQPHIYRHFTWQAWHHLTSTVVFRGRRGTYGTGWRAWTWLGARDATAFCVAGVAQPHIYRHFTWQAWHHLTSTVVLRGGRGTYGTGWRAWTWLGARDAAALCVAGVAQPHIYRHFTWQAWHHLTSTVVLRGRRGTYGTGWRAWTWLGARDAAAFCVAGVAQPHIYRHFTWQAWHHLTSTVVLRGRRGTYGTGWRAWTWLGARDAAAFCVAGVAQPHIYRRFAWQAWHLWHWVARLVLVSACVAGAAQSHIYHRFAWVLRGRCGTDGSRNTHLAYFCVVPTCFLACLRMSCSGMSYGRSGMFYFLTRCLLRFVCSAGLFTHVLLRHSFWSLRHVVVTYCHVFALSITASFRVFRHVWFPGMFNPLLLSACFISIRICCQVLVFVFVVPTDGRAQCGKKRMQMPGEPTLLWIFATPVCFWTVWFLDIFGKTCTVSVITMVFACDCVVSSIVALTTSYIRVLYFCGQVPFLYVIIVGCIHACMHTYIHSFIHTYHFTFSIFHHLLCLSFLPCPR